MGEWLFLIFPIGIMTCIFFATDRHKPLYNKYLMWRNKKPRYLAGDKIITITTPDPEEWETLEPDYEIEKVGKKAYKVKSNPNKHTGYIMVNSLSVTGYSTSGQKETMDFVQAHTKYKLMKLPGKEQVHRDFFSWLKH